MHPLDEVLLQCHLTANYVAQLMALCCRLPTLAQLASTRHKHSADMLCIKDQLAAGPHVGHTFGASVGVGVGWVGVQAVAAVGLAVVAVVVVRVEGWVVVVVKVAMVVVGWVGVV